MLVIGTHVWALVMLLFVPAAADAAECALVNGRPTSGGEGYRLRPGGGRCEGTYESSVAGEAIQLVSLTRGRPSYDLVHPVTLSIQLATPTAGKPAHLRAVGIRPLFYYQMDSVTDLAPGQVFDWPVSDVLAHLAGVEPTDIGIFAVHKDLGGRDVFEPVDVMAAGQPAQPQQRIVVVLKPQQTLNNAKWRFSQNGQAPPPWQPLPVRSDRAEIVLGPGDVPLSGRLDVRWDDTSSGAPRTAAFLIGD